MKTPDHEQKLHLDGTAKPGIQKTLDCHRDLRNLRGRPRQRSDLGDEYLYGVAISDFAYVNGSLASILPVHPASAGLAGPTGRLFPTKPLWKRFNRSSPRELRRRRETN
jgi:hypothetical protein